jgi:hypothetical protein
MGNITPLIWKLKPTSNGMSAWGQDSPFFRSSRHTAMPYGETEKSRLRPAEGSQRKLAIDMKLNRPKTGGQTLYRH